MLAGAAASLRLNTHSPVAQLWATLAYARLRQCSIGDGSSVLATWLSTVNRISST
jgi:hypothetical protein